MTKITLHIESGFFSEEELTKLQEISLSYRVFTFVEKEYISYYILDKEITYYLDYIIDDYDFFSTEIKRLESYISRDEFGALITVYYELNFK
jgi:hypothetical protein